MGICPGIDWSGVVYKKKEVRKGLPCLSHARTTRAPQTTRRRRASTQILYISVDILIGIFLLDLLSEGDVGAYPGLWWSVARR